MTYLTGRGVYIYIDIPLAARYTLYTYDYKEGCLAWVQKHLKFKSNFAITLRYNSRQPVEFKERAGGVRPCPSRYIVLHSAAIRIAPGSAICSRWAAFGSFCAINMCY